MSTLVDRNAVLVKYPPPVVAAPPVFAGRLRDGWSFEVFDRIAALDPRLWQSCFPPHWKDYRYYHTLEETLGGQFTQRYLVLSSDRAEGVGPDRRVRAIQPLFFVEQDLTVSLAPWLRAMLRPLQGLLRMRLLMAGCIVGEAQIGVPEPADLPRLAAPLTAALECYARHESVSIVLLKDVPSEHRANLRSLADGGGYTRLASLPAVTLPLDFANFDDYLQTRLGKATRKSLRRKFREVATLSDPITLEVKSSINEAEAAALHGLYERVARRGEVNFEVFTPDYFLQLGQRMPDLARYFIWRQAGRIVAFSFCTVHAGTIYDNDLGLADTPEGSLHLYHVSFRDIVRWALAQGLERYYSSPFNYHPKLHLRMDLVPLDLYARHLSPVCNWLLRRFAPLASPIRQEPLLREFPNSASL